MTKIDWSKARTSHPDPARIIDVEYNERPKKKRKKGSTPSKWRSTIERANSLIAGQKSAAKIKRWRESILEKNREAKRAGTARKS